MLELKIVKETYQLMAVTGASGLLLLLILWLISLVLKFGYGERSLSITIMRDGVSILLFALWFYMFLLLRDLMGRRRGM